MSAPKMSLQEMSARIARFADLRPNPQMFVDTRLPEHERELFSVIGPGVSEDRETRPAIGTAEDFNIAYISAHPGKGAALHSHTTVEVFIPLTGKWKIYWNEGAEQQSVVLGPWDCISMPKGIMRGFANAGTEYAYMIGIVGGADSGKVSWSKAVLDRAESTGLRLDADGNLIVDAAAE